MFSEDGIHNNRMIPEDTKWQPVGKYERSLRQRGEKGV